MLQVEEDFVGDLGATLGLGGLGEENRHDSQEEGGREEDSLHVQHSGLIARRSDRKSN